MEKFKTKIREILLWSEKYTKTDMIYLTSGIFWIGINKVFIFLFSFFLMLAFSHLASKEIFGSYQYILSILGIVSIFSLPGTNLSLMKSIAQKKEGTLKEIINTRLRWSLIGSFFIFCIAFWYFYKSNIILGVAIAVTGVGMPLFQSYDSFGYFWMGRKNFKKGMFYNALSTIIPVCIITVTLFFSENLIVIMSIFILSNSMANYFFAQKTLKQVNNNEIDAGAIKLGKSLTVMQGIEIINNYIDKIFIWIFLGSIPVAIYSFAQIPISKMQQLAPIQALSLPKLSEQSMEGQRLTVIKNFLKLFIIVIPVTLLFIIFIPILYEVFFPQYVETIPYVRALGSLLVLMPFTYLTTAMIAESRGYEIAMIQIVIFIFRIILFFALISNYGIWGIIYATITTEILKSVLTLYFFKKNNLQ